MKKVLRFLDDYFEEVFGVILLFAITILLGVGVFFRYVLNNSLSWSDELARYFHIWAVFVGLGLCAKYDLNMKVDILEHSIPKLKPVLLVVQDLIYLAFLVYTLGPSITVIQKTIATPQGSPAMGMPMQYLYLCYPIGCVLAIIRILQKFYKRFKSLKKSDNKEEEATI